MTIPGAANNFFACLSKVIPRRAFARMVAKRMSGGIKK